MNFIIFWLLHLVSSQRSVINPSINEQHNSTKSYLYYERSFTNVFVYKHAILIRSFVSLSCINQDDNPFSNNSYLINVRWYSRGEPIYTSEFIRCYVDLFGFIALMPTKVGTFQIICTGVCIYPNGQKKDVTILHTLSIYDSSVQINTLYSDLSIIYKDKLDSNSTNSTIDEANRKLHYQVFLANKVKPCSSSFQKRVKKLAKKSFQTVCNSVDYACDNIFVNYYDCSFSDGDLQINISLDLSFYYSYRKINIYAPVLDYDIRTKGQKEIKKLCSIQLFQFVKDLTQTEFAQYSDRLLFNNITKYRKELFCIGSASLLNPNNEQMCILCGTGTYIAAFYAPVLSNYRKGGLCKLCPKDHYSDTDGSYECIPCPPRSITFFEGAYEVEQCHNKDQLYLRKLILQYISEKGYFKFVHKLSETQKIIVLGIFYFLPCIVIGCLWLVHNSFVNENNLLNDLYLMQLELGKIVIMVTYRENLMKDMVEEKRDLYNEVFLPDSYEQ